MMNVVKKAFCKTSYGSLDDLSTDQMANCILTPDITIDFLRDELGDDSRNLKDTNASPY